MEAYFYLFLLGKAARKTHFLFQMGGRGAARIDFDSSFNSYFLQNQCIYINTIMSLGGQFHHQRYPKWPSFSISFKQRKVKRCPKLRAGGVGGIKAMPKRKGVFCLGFLSLKVKCSWNSVIGEETGRHGIDILIEFVFLSISEYSSLPYSTISVSPHDEDE